MSLSLCFIRRNTIFVDSQEEFKEATRQKLASLELNSNWGGEFDRISQRLDHINDRQIVIESRATGVPMILHVVKTYYKASLPEDGNREETHEMVEFEDAPVTSRSASLPVNDEHVTRRATRLSRDSDDTNVLSEPMSSYMIRTSPERVNARTGESFIVFHKAHFEFYPSAPQKIQIGLAHKCNQK